MKWIIRSVTLFITSTTIIQCCENEKIIACPRKNMTCLKSVCSCGSKAPLEYFYHMYITCTNVLDDIPADIPKEALYISMTGNNLTTIKAGAFEGIHSIDRLYLSGNKIEIIEPGAFVDLPSLYVLDLSNNKLTRLMTGVFRNIPVQTMYLGNNNITDIESEAFYNLSRISAIFLTGNPIHSIRTDTFKNLSVTHIDFSGSRISVIESRAFNNLWELSEIVLANRNITEIQHNAFAYLPKLETLVLHGNSLTRIDENTFGNLPALTSLYLSGNQIEIIEPGAFVDLTSLAMLELSNNKLTIIMTGVFRNIPVQAMYLGNNNITDIESEAFYNLSGISVIYLNGNPIHTIRTDAFKNLPVAHIDFSGSRISVIESRAFINLWKISSFVLSNRNITEIEHNAFAYLPKLETLRLDGNSLTRIDENTFCNLPALTYLYLSGNKIEVIEPGAFVDLPSLALLELSNNKLTRLMTGVFWNIPVQAMFLRNNNLTDIERETFYNLSKISVIYLTGNPILTIRTDTFKNLPVAHIDFSGSRISVIESRAFNNLWQLSALTTFGPITKINSEAFFNLSSLNTLILSSRNITEIQHNAFAYLPQLTTLRLDDNSLTQIDENTFCNLPALTYLTLSVNKITALKTKSFCNLPALQRLILSGNPLSMIEQDAFVNVQATTLVIGIDQNFVMNENIQNNITSIYFIGNPVNCNCSFLWFPLWLKNRPLTTVNGTCKDLNKTVDKLVQEDLKYCYDLTEIKSRNILQSIELTCTSRYISSKFEYWVYSKYGVEILKLSGQYVTLDANVLSIAFCSYEDAGDYTCVRTTNYSALPKETFTTKLSVQGPPMILNQSTQEVGNNLILSVVFYCDPYNEPDWLLGETILTESSEHMMSTSPYLITTNERLPRIYEGFLTNLTIVNYKQFLSQAYTCRIKNIYGEVKEIIISQLVSIIMDRTIYCDTSSKAEIKCSIGFVGAIAGLWTHSYNGQIIRTLPGTVVNNTNILLIPFCSYQDMGDYTCTWNTNVSDLLTLNRTSTVEVSGPPLLLDYLISRDGNDTILSVFFFSQPFPSEPKWYFQEHPVVLGYGYDYQQITNFATVKVRQHKRAVNRQGFVCNLTIINSRSILYGTYTCKIENSFGYLQHDFVVNEAIVPQTRQSSSPSDISTTIIVSVSVSAVVVFIVIIIAVVCRRGKPAKDEYADSPMPSSSVPDLYNSIRLSTLQEPSPDYFDVY